jgi:hypothetical protein
MNFTSIKIFMSYMLLALNLIGLCMPVQAGNIYKSGSEADALFKNVQDVLPADVAIVYLMKDDRGRFLKQVDANAFIKAGLTTKTVDYLLARVSPKLTAESGVRAYTIAGQDIPGNEVRKKYVSIVVTNEHWLKDKGTMFHEGLHAKNTYVNGTDAYQKAVLPVWKVAGKSMTTEQFMALLDEAVVAGQQVAYTYNEGKQAGIEMIQQYASADHNGRVSIGYRTARNMLQKCGHKDACQTDTVQMINIIAHDPVILDDLAKDMSEIMDASKKLGVVVADQ